MLGAGATLRVATEEELRDPERLGAILRDEGITTWNSAPAALLQLVPFFPPPGEGRSLRRVLLAGDWIPLSLPDRIRESFPERPIGNFGGATETSVWSNWHPVGAVDPAWASIPYGRPLANNRYYVLDGALEPCPPGVPGDNYIGGGCPALGYAGQPALTAERFLPDPFSPEPGRAHVRHRRPRPLRGGRRHGIPRPRRLPGQGAGVPHRAGGDRGGPAAPPRDPRGGGPGARGRRRGEAAGGLRGAFRGRQGRPRRRRPSSASPSSGRCRSTWSPGRS